MRVIGTAGHVDHGKSVLVKALTGIDPDRLKEEKEREMTIDLGFAWFTLPSGLVVSIIDMPGHEDFIKNMLAGVGGIDAALLVVAADEGVMPQTVEHLAILDLLEVRRGVVALTKVDLVEDEEWLELVAADVDRLLKGTTLAGSKILPLSAVTGQGIPSLIEQLDSLLLSETSPRRERGRPRLPIDRAFTLAGFGTVVTGTLIGGRFRVGQEVEILPQGLKSRIRGLQTHKEKIEVALPGSRVAINLVGVGKDQLQRGDVVTSPGWLEPTRLVDVRLRMLGSAPKPLRHNASVDFYSGAAQIPAKARVLGAKVIESGEEGWVQLALTRPTALLAHDRFIIRQPSPSLTIGGGTVVDPHPRRRHKRFRPRVVERLEALTLGTPQEVLLEALEEGPQEMRRLVKDSGLEPEVVEEALERLLEGSRVLVLGASEGLLVSSTWWEGFLTRLVHLIEEYHGRYPLRLGMPREEVKSKLRFPSRLFNDLIGQAVKEGAVAQEGAALRLPSHEVRFTPEEEERVERLLSILSQEPYITPSVADCKAAVGEEVFNALLGQGRVVQVSENILFLTSTYEVMVERVVEHLKKEGTITLAQVRDLFSTSRKYAQPFLEHLDAQGITRRVGDERVLR